jgi:hypothetical protein
MMRSRCAMRRTWFAVCLTMAFGSAFVSEAEEPLVPKIEPPRLTAERQTIELSSECTDIVAGGGGRYLILWLPTEQKLAVFDVSAARVVKEIPVASTDMEFTAGANCLVVALRDQKILQRWSLTSFEREATEPFPDQVQIQRLAMGSMSAGPIGIVARQLPFKIGFLDVATLKLVDRQFILRRDETIDGVEEVDVRASARGNTFVVKDQGGDSLICDLTGGAVNCYPGQYSSKMFATPSASGQRVYAGPGFLGSYGNAWMTPHDNLKWSAIIPAVHGDWYLALQGYKERDDRKGGGGVFGGGGGGFGGGGGGAIPLKPKPKKKDAPLDPALRVQLYHATDHRLVAELPDVDLTSLPEDEKFGRTKPQPPLDKRAWLVPEAKVLAVLARSNRQLVLHRIDVEKLAGTAKSNPLILHSEPPTVVRAGEKLRYALQVLAPLGGLKYQLLKGPPEMRIDAAGVVAWDVPKTIPASWQDVIISATDASKREVLQAVVLAIKPAADANVDVAKPDDVQAAAIPPAGPIPASPPPEFEGEELTVPLDDVITDLAPGGAGRYLVLYFRTRGEVAVFDVSRAKIIYRIPVHDAQVHLAAGLEKLVIVLAEKRVALKYDLATGRREMVERLSGERPLVKATMGSASHGPLITGSYRRHDIFVGPALYDLATLRRLPVEGGRGDLFRENFYVRAFRDGTMYGGDLQHSGNYCAWVLVANKLYEVSRLRKPGQPPTGLDYCPLTLAEEVFVKQVYESTPTIHHKKWTMVAERGNYFLTFDYKPTSGITDLRLHLIGDERPLADLNVEVPNDPDRRDVDTRLPPDRRVHLLADAGILVTVPLPADRLVLRKVNVKQLVERSPINYLIVSSTPPPTVPRGGLFKYAIKAISKHGSVKYNLDLGPPGMTISPNGEVEWRVPPDGSEQEQKVVLSIRDAGDQERLQSFALRITGVAEPAEEAEVRVAMAARLWIDKTGKHRTRATLLEVLAGDKVRLQKENGTVIVVALDTLSDVDRDYVRRQSEKE